MKAEASLEGTFHSAGPRLTPFHFVFLVPRNQAFLASSSSCMSFPALSDLREQVCNFKSRRHHCRALTVQVQENGRTHLIQEDTYVKKQQSLKLEKVSGDFYFILMCELCLTIDRRLSPKLKETSLR